MSLSDRYGVTIADGVTHYKDQAHTLLYDAGQPLHALDLQDGTFSRQFCKAYLSDGNRAPLDSVGRIKHQVDYGVALLNSLLNADFSNGITSWTLNSAGTPTVADGIVSFTVTSPGGRIQQQISKSSGDVIFRCALIKANSSLVGVGDAGTLLSGHSGGGSFELVSNLRTETSDNRYFSILDTRASGFDEIQCDYSFEINMTTLGIESFTKAQMLALVQDGYFDDYKFFPESTNDGPNSIRLQQDYPLVQSADLTDTLVDDHTLDEPTNAVVEVATLNYQIGNQIFSKVDSGELSKFLVYDREMTNEEVAKILLFMQTGEFAIDSDGDYAIDSNGDMAVAPKSEYYL